MMNKLEGLIFKTQTYKETSRLLQTYTPMGRITLMAHGAEKPNNKDRILAQYLTHFEFEYTDFKDFMSLKNAKIINSFPTIKTDYNKVKDISLILEVIDRTIIGNENHEMLFKMALDAINHPNTKVSALSFAFKTLYYLGYGIDLKGDGRKIKGVNINLGKLVYIDESDSVFLDYDQTLSLLKIIYTKTNELEQFDDVILKVLKDFLGLYYEYHLNIKLNALK